MLAIGGYSAMIIVMVILRLNAQESQGSRKKASGPAIFLTWICLLAFVFVVALLLGAFTVKLFPRGQPHLESQTNPVSQSDPGITEGTAEITEIGHYSSSFSCKPGDSMGTVVVCGPFRRVELTCPKGDCEAYYGVWACIVPGSASKIPIAKGEKWIIQPFPKENRLCLSDHSLSEIRVVGYK